MSDGVYAKEDPGMPVTVCKPAMSMSQHPP